MDDRKYNCTIWIFRAQFARPDIARKVLKTIAGSKVSYDANDEVYSAKVIESIKVEDLSRQE